MNGSDLDGRALRVDLSINKETAIRNRGAPTGGNNARNAGTNEVTATVFVGNMSWNTNEDTLRSFFGEFGDILSVRIPTDKETGKVKGYVLLLLFILSFYPFLGTRFSN